MKRNETIKRRLRAEGVAQWRLAEAVGISDQTLYRLLRQEITPERFEELSAAIDKLVEGGTDDER